MNKSTNERVRVKVKLAKRHVELVKELDSMAKRLGVTQSELCEYLLTKAASRVSFSGKSVTSRQGVSKKNKKGIK